MPMYDQDGARYLGIPTLNVKWCLSVSKNTVCGLCSHIEVEGRKWLFLNLENAIMIVYRITKSRIK